MSAAQPAIATLRLVNTDDAPHASSLPEDHAQGRHAAWRIATENHEASRLAVTDARWVFAVQVSRNLSGGRAGALPPERRAALMSTARTFGLRPFDASLIIAVVQDGARTGEGLSRELEHRLGMIPAPDRGNGSNVSFGLLVAAFLLGMAGFAALVAWLGV